MVRSRVTVGLPYYKKSVDGRSSTESGASSGVNDPPMNDARLQGFAPRKFGFNAVGVGLCDAVLLSGPFPDNRPELRKGLAGEV